MNTDSKNTPEDLDVDHDTLERDDAVIGVALRRSVAVFAIAAVLIGASVYMLTPSTPTAVVRETTLAEVQVRTAPKVAIPTVRFTDITREAGIDWLHENAAAGLKLLPETMGGGCAFFDFDGDGHQDVLLINSLRRWPWDDAEDRDGDATMALYRNNGDGTFTDVTAGSGLDVSMYGMGVAVGDYMNNGHVDVFISALGKNRLFRNNGDGTFTDVTDEAGVGGDEHRWSVSSGFFDYDNDGLLDLFVCNYVEWSREYDEAQNFQLIGGGRAYGRPQNFEGTFPYLYRNNGDGTFTEVSAEAGLQVRNPHTGVPMSKALGLAFIDVDTDGWMDIIVANDTVQNFLFHNQGDGTFKEVGALAGVAFDMNGNARGAMGIDVERFRSEDAIGIAIGNFANEMTALYVAYGDQLQFMDEAIPTGLGPNTRLELTFGVFYTDYDLDGRLDLFQVNGHLEDEINRVQPSQHYEQPPQLFWNCGAEHDTEFMPVTAEHAGSDLFRPLVGRGAAYADIDGDGDCDYLVTSLGQHARLLRNDQALGHNWLRFKLIGTRSNRDAIGARVVVKVDDRTLCRHVMPTRSYLSQVELPVTFGLGTAESVSSVTIHWPDGSTQSVDVLELNRMVEVVQDIQE